MDKNEFLKMFQQCLDDGNIKIITTTNMYNWSKTRVDIYLDEGKDQNDNKTGI